MLQYFMCVISKIEFSSSIHAKLNHFFVMCKKESRNYSQLILIKEYLLHFTAFSGIIGQIYISISFQKSIFCE
ncbi:hypothetical protein M2459_003429 [Parabacteroides sp. PF5-5]|nr:hypothetical protein [Parabacteroides sp. PH5-39]MDH6317669.1 hypothetical protein [Parabacteroides sp. PF5-13]MDH6321495.1 hypothetical protein [Parabacteroides sp. PH5-13]MDH6325228.1 hypothetical protein [Parabacteroides sp. PH5-8]MDH6328854.1 hypothetical protein [Parabacteroides sp. PH5-41]MDH6336656.1 hypothetical protein [Parabacteroides sp. PF5-5]MDH6347720.1 hypothetical protein [Parabacteroides sp. PH5-46]MDH6362684.1 hypothetical protein [Parabacteroides sp. PH5-16]MDH6378352.